MEVRYRNDLYGNYMLIEIPEIMDTNQYSFKMLEKNRIPGVLSGKERREDGKGYWYIDVSQKRNLVQEYKDKEMQLEDMIEIFQQITPVLEELRTYLLSEAMVIMDPEYIFRDLEDHRLHLMILPWNTEEKTLHKLAEFFLEKINNKDENGVNAAYLFYRQQSQSHFSLYHFLPVLEKESILKRQKIKEKGEQQKGRIEAKEEISKEKNEYIWQESVLDECEKDTVSKKELRNVKKRASITALLLSAAFLGISFLPIVNTAMSISCMALSLLLFIIFLAATLYKDKNKEKVRVTEKKGETSAQEIDIGTKETVFFDSFESEEYLKLQWKERGRKKQFVLKDFPCTAGKMKEDVDMYISDISVSRIHCRFVEQENKVCIMDLNSTNGTFLNGLPLKNGEILEIEKNDEILIGKVMVNVV